MMTKRNYIKMQTFNAAFTALVLGASFYFQYFKGLSPCPLCIMQRICVFLLLILILFSLKKVKKIRIISVLQLFVACSGLFFSLRQLWLQSLPEGSAPACLPGLDVAIRYFPWQTIVKTLFWGSADCAEVNWSLLGISMPGWSSLYFIVMIFMSCFLFLQSSWSHSKPVIEAKEDELKEEEK